MLYKIATFQLFSTTLALEIDTVAKKSQMKFMKIQCDIVEQKYADLEIQNF